MRRMSWKTKVQNVCRLTFLAGACLTSSVLTAANQLFFDYIGKRAAWTYESGFADIPVFGPIERDDFMIRVRQKKIEGMLSCTHRVRPDHFQPDSKEVTPIYKCTMKVESDQFNQLIDSTTFAP